MYHIYSAHAFCHLTSQGPDLSWCECKLGGLQSFKQSPGYWVYRYWWISSGNWFDFCSICRGILHGWWIKVWMRILRTSTSVGRINPEGVFTSPKTEKVLQPKSLGINATPEIQTSHREWITIDLTESNHDSIQHLSHKKIRTSLPYYKITSALNSEKEKEKENCRLWPFNETHFGYNKITLGFPYKTPT